MNTTATGRSALSEKGRQGHGDKRGRNLLSGSMLMPSDSLHIPKELGCGILRLRMAGIE